jgi:serine/threonine protein kinase
VSPVLLKTDENVAGYTIRERIGAGGYGEVWRADAPGGIAKALKFIYGCLDDERAGCELKALNRVKEVRHPFLLSLERIEVVDGQLVIVTELADMCLKDRFKQCQQSGLTGIPRDELLGYMHDAADALDYMNERYSLQHLDIKPENLLLLGNHIKVADFGLVKEIEDKTMSLLGGLTPVYASPESFMGQPSHCSDQYSLAIVYQEMLTGELPFPGKTAGQLTSQHLHAKPRLTPLPPREHAVIARALAKEPRDRFPNCRALAESLLAAGHAESENARRPASQDDTRGHAANAAPTSVPVETPKQRQPVVTERLPPPVGPSPTDPSSSSQAQASASATIPCDRNNPFPSPCSEPEFHDAALSDGHAGASNGYVLTPLAKPSIEARISDLPPIECDESMRFQPTLFVGIGGTAARTLQRLRRHLFDRFGGLEDLPAVEMLLLETDPTTIAKVTQGEPDAALRPHQVLSLPLRQPHEYREDSERFLRWLSRRWLYNIPRSLRTEGIRPLGRVAFVDHARRVMAQLRSMLQAVTRPEAVAKSLKTLGVEAAGPTPRIYVIASICGGAGSGMVLDVAYAIRKTLGEMGLSADGLRGLLTLSTTRNPGAKELALANAYACLSELQQYSRSGYTADPASGLPDVEEEIGTFRDTYLVHLGDDLTEDRYVAAIDGLTEYLYLDSVTTAGRFFDQCRDESTSSCGRSSSDINLRTFGLSQIGYVQSNLPDLATEFLAQSIVQRWQGNAQWKTAKFSDASAENPRPTYDEIAASVSLESLLKEVQRIVECETGGDAIACFRREMQRMFTKAAQNGREGITTVEALDAIGEILGDRSGANENGSPVPGRLHAVLTMHLKEMAAWRGTELFEWLYAMVDHSDVRVEGAHHASAWVRDRLHAVENEVEARIKSLVLRLGHLEKEMVDAEAAQNVRGKGWFHLGLSSKPAAGFAERWAECFQLRLDIIVLRAINAMARSLRTKIVVVADQLADLRRRLLMLSDQFPVDSLWTMPELPDDEFSLAESPHSDPFHAVARILQRQMPSLAAQMDEQLRKDEESERVGLQDFLRNEAEVRVRLPVAIRAASRIAVFGALQQIDLAEAFFDSPANTTRTLQSWLHSASPTLSKCGGQRRLLLVCPRGCGQGRLPELVREGTGQTPSCVCDSDVNMVLCYEMQNVSLARVAEMMTVEDSECAHLASRIHTRTDVAWASMLSSPSVC